MYTFSDCAYIFYGGISYGDVYADTSKSMFFGDAVNKAYKMVLENSSSYCDYIAKAVLEIYHK